MVVLCMQAQKLMDALKHKEKELDELLITLQDKDKKIEIVEITKGDLVIIRLACVVC